MDSWDIRYSRGLDLRVTRTLCRYGYFFCLGVVHPDRSSWIKGTQIIIPYRILYVISSSWPQLGCVAYSWGVSIHLWSSSAKDYHRNVPSSQGDLLQGKNDIIPFWWFDEFAFSNPSPSTQKIRTASCDKMACFNKFGDEQLAIDILANNVIFQNLKKCGSVETASSEETPIEDPMGGQGYSVAFDPLDGSSIIDTNFAVGTIWGVWPGNRLVGMRDPKKYRRYTMSAYPWRSLRVVRSMPPPEYESTSMQWNLSHAVHVPHPTGHDDSLCLVGPTYP